MQPTEPIVYDGDFDGLVKKVAPLRPNASLLKLVNGVSIRDTDFKVNVRMGDALFFYDGVVSPIIIRAENVDTHMIESSANEGFTCIADQLANSARSVVGGEWVGGITAPTSIDDLSKHLKRLKASLKAYDQMGDF